MGGPGSGNHHHRHRPRKRATVEECASLEAGAWARRRILTAGAQRRGTWAWAGSSIAYTVNTLDMAAPRVVLEYSWASWLLPRPLLVRYTVPLATTRPRFGGLRWWFRCPGEGGRGTCGRRVGKLYLPRGKLYFACRHCHELTYRTCQEGYKQKRLDKLLAEKGGRIAPEVVAAAQRLRALMPSMALRLLRDGAK